MKLLTFHGRPWCPRCGLLGSLWAYTVPDLASRIARGHDEHRDAVHSGDAQPGDGRRAA